MGFADKADAMKDKLVGKAKEGAGKATGDEELEAEGEGQNLQGKIKDTVEQVKDTSGDIRDRAKGFTDGFNK